MKKVEEDNKERRIPIMLTEPSENITSYKFHNEFEIDFP